MPALTAAGIFRLPGVLFYDLATHMAGRATILGWARDNGFGWAAVQCFNDLDGAGPLLWQDEIPAWRDAIRDHGLHFGLWGVQNDSPSADASRADSQIDLWGADFYIADAEIKYKSDGPGTKAHSATFCTAFRAAQPDVPAALSTYGAVASESGALGDALDDAVGVFDMAAWYDAGFHYLPQAYASDATYEMGRVIRHARRCRWPYSRIHPTCGIYAGGDTYGGADYRAFMRAMNNAEYEEAVRGSSPKCLWKCQDASGTVLDMMPGGLSMDGINGTPDYAQAGPFPGTKSMWFQGGEWLSRTSPVSAVTDNLTIEVIVRIIEVGLDNQVLLYNGLPGSNGWGVVVSTNNTFRYLCGGVAFGANSQRQLPDRFAHLAVVRRSGTWEYYLDGALDTANAGTSNPGAATDSAWIGDGQASGKAIGFACAFAAVYETALSAATIRAHAEAMGAVRPNCSPETAHGFSLFLGETGGTYGAAVEQDYVDLGLAASIDRCAWRRDDRDLAGIVVPGGVRVSS